MTQQDKPLRCYAYRHDSGLGVVLRNPVWIPDGDDPPRDEDYRRAPWLDQPSATPEPVLGTGQDCGKFREFKHDEKCPAAERSPEAAGVYPTADECVPWEDEWKAYTGPIQWRAEFLAHKAIDWANKRSAATNGYAAALLDVCETLGIDVQPDAASVLRAVVAREEKFGPYAARSPGRRPTERELHEREQPGRAPYPAPVTVMRWESEAGDMDKSVHIALEAVDWANQWHAARSPDCTCNIHPSQPHERWCPKSEHYGEAKEAEGYHRGYADALASVAQEMGIDGRDRAGLTAWIAAARSPGGTLTAEPYDPGPFHPSEDTVNEWVTEHRNRGYAGELQLRLSDVLVPRTLEWERERVARAGAQPPMGLPREDVERIVSIIRAHRQTNCDANDEYLAGLDELAARLRSLPTSTDRVLATHHGVEVVGPEGTPTTEPMSWPDDDVAPDIGRLVEDWARNFGLRVTRIHVTPTTEGDDQ